MGTRDTVEQLEAAIGECVRLERELAAVEQQRFDAATEERRLAGELAAVQAVVAEVRDLLDELDLDSGKTTAPGTAWGSILRESKVALAGAGTSVLADAIRQAKAEAWDEGYTRGFYDREMMPGEVRDAAEGPSENPYRADRFEREGADRAE